MFISTKDKESIIFSIEDLYSRVEKLNRSLNAAIDKLAAKEEMGNVLEAQRKKRNAYASAYYYKRKAEKASLTNQGKI